VVQRRQAPGRHVVNLLTETTLAAAVLLLDELLALRDVGVEQVAREPSRRLIERHDDRAGRHRAAAGLERLVGAPHLDALSGQTAAEMRRTRRVVFGSDNHVRTRAGLAEARRAAAVLEIVAHHLFAIA